MTETMASSVNARMDILETYAKLTITIVLLIRVKMVAGALTLRM